MEVDRGHVSLGCTYYRRKEEEKDREEEFER
jgi:hypothetical protein